MVLAHDAGTGIRIFDKGTLPMAGPIASAHPPAWPANPNEPPTGTFLGRAGGLGGLDNAIGLLTAMSLLAAGLWIHSKMTSRKARR